MPVAPYDESDPLRSATFTIVKDANTGKWAAQYEFVDAWGKPQIAVTAHPSLDAMLSMVTTLTRTGALA